MTETLAIDPQKVEEIFIDCLFRDGEDTTNLVAAEGITCTVGFNPERLESHREEVEALLAGLPDEFRESVGGGWSFLNACYDRYDNLWTGLQLRMEQLFQLGIAIGKVEHQIPRELWSALPGGMPYLVLKMQSIISVYIQGWLLELLDGPTSKIYKKLYSLEVLLKNS